MRGRKTAVALLPLVLCLLTAPALPNPDNEMHAGLKVDEVLPVLLQAGPGESTDTLQLVWIVFRDSEATLDAALRCTMLSWPKARWEVNLTLLNAAGEVVGAQAAVLENSGTIISVPMLQTGDLGFTFDKAHAKAARTFAVSVAVAPEDAAVNASLSGIPSSGKPAPEGDCSIDVQVLDSRGEAAAWGMIVWRKLEAAPEPDPLNVFSGPTVYWTDGASTYEACRSIGGSVRDDYEPDGDSSRYTISKLPPGAYRLSAYTAIRPDSRDLTPAGASGLIEVTGDRKVARCEITLEDGFPLTVQVVDSEGSPAASVQVVVVRKSDGMPVAQGTATDETGTLRLGSLKPGAYSIEVGRRDWWAVLHPETLTHKTVVVRASSGNVATIRHDQSEPVRASL